MYTAPGTGLWSLVPYVLWPMYIISYIDNVDRYVCTYVYLYIYMYIYIYTQIWPHSLSLSEGRTLGTQGPWPSGAQGPWGPHRPEIRRKHWPEIRWKIDDETVDQKFDKKCSTNFLESLLQNHQFLRCFNEIGNFVEFQFYTTNMRCFRSTDFRQSFCWKKSQFLH